MKKRIYLDYNATAKLRPDVRDRMVEIMDTPHNASSVHGFGREGRAIIEKAREEVAALVGAQASQVIFNSGATEGNNTVLSHFKGARILISAIEHPSVREAAEHAEIIPVTPEGLINLEALEKCLQQKPQTGLISLMLVSNETGIIQPVAQAARLAKKYGSLVHCDAVQGAGRIPVDLTELNVDFLTVSAHKLGGPQGAGALVLGLCGDTPILLKGGQQEKGARAGTENVAAIAGFGLAAKIARDNLEAYKSLEKQRDKMEKELGTLQGLTIHGQNVPRVANTTLLTLPDVSSEVLLMALDLEGIAVSNGSACSSGTTRPSATLKAMGLSDKDASSALRISLGWATTDEEIDIFLKTWSKITTRICGQ